MTYLVLKDLHIVGAAVLLGTGACIAFFMGMAHLTRDATFVTRTAAVVVWADLIFTASAVVAQPITGYLLIRENGIPILDRWIVASLGFTSLPERSGCQWYGCRSTCAKRSVTR